MGLPEGYIIRRIEEADYERGVLDTLAVLTTVGAVPKIQFEQILAKWDSLEVFNGSKIYNPLVIVDTNSDRVVATGMIFIEEKIIHQGGLVGHIEDISVARDQQGKHLGKFLITELIELGKKAGCYKTILDCDPKNVGFYEKCGLKKEGCEMEIRY